MKFALQLGSRELALTIGQKVSPDMAAWLRGDDVTAESGGAQLTSAYQQSTWVYACITAIGHQLAQIPLRVSRGQRMPYKGRTLKWRAKAAGEDLIESGPLVELLNRPHPQLTRFDFWNLFVAWLMLRGEAFTIPTTETNEVVSLAPGAGKGVRRLVLLSPDMIREEVQMNMLVGWRYTGNTRTPLPTETFLPEEVMFAKLPNPFDFWRGMAPLVVARVAAQSDYASAQFEKGLMLNNADTGVIVTTDQQLSEEQRQQFMAALRERKRKAGTADRPLFLSSGCKIEKPALSSADLQFLDNRKFKRQELCAIFGVPQEVLGFTEDANRSVSDAARLNFIENTVASVCELVESALDPLARAFDPNFYIWCDVDALPIMQRARQTRFKTAAEAFVGLGVPVNVLNPLFDLGLPDDLPHGDKVFLPFNLQEFGAPEPTPAAPPPKQDFFERAARLLMFLGNGKGSATVPVAGEGVPARAEPHVCMPSGAYEAAIAGSIRVKRSKLSKFFFEQRSRVLAKLGNLQKQNEEGRAKTTFNIQHSTFNAQLRAIDDVFDPNFEDATLIARMKPLYLGDLEFGGAQLFQEIGLIDFKLPPRDAIKFLAATENALKGVNETTFDALKETLSEGLDQGEAYNDLADRVRNVFQEASDHRAETIAVTETNKAINGGRFSAMREARVENKGWQTSRLENTRQAHLDAEDRYGKTGIPLDEPFIVDGEELMFPGDPNGSPGNVINCRCFTFAVIAEKSLLDRGGLARDRDGRAPQHKSAKSGPILTFEEFLAAKKTPETALEITA